MSLSTQLLNRQARKSHARVWTLTDRLCTRTFRVCTPTLLKSERFAAQRRSDPLGYAHYTQYSKTAFMTQKE